MDTQPVSRAYFEGFLDDTRRQAVIVGEVAAQTVAWGIVKQYSERPGYQYACEISVYVAEAYQGKGYGAALLGAVIASARSLHYRHLVAKVLAVNEPSIRFFRRVNFEVVGRQRAIGFLNGKWHDVVIMQRVFDDIRPREHSEEPSS